MPSHSPYQTRAEVVGVVALLVERGELLDRQIVHVVPAEVLAELGQDLGQGLAVLDLGGRQHGMGNGGPVRLLKLDGAVDPLATVHGAPSEDAVNVCTASAVGQGRS